MTAAKVEKQIQAAVAGALLSSRRGWTTGSLRLSRDVVFAAVMPILKREIARARGKTVGYVIVRRLPEKRGHTIQHSYHGEPMARRASEYAGADLHRSESVARVVLVRKPVAKRRKR